MLEKCCFRQQFRPEILRSKNRFRKLKQCEPLQLNSGLPFRLRMAGFYNAMHVINVISAYRLIDNFTASPLLSSHSQPLCAARSVSLAPTSIQRTLSPLHNCFEMHTLICLYLAISYYITHLQQVNSLSLCTVGDLHLMWYLHLANHASQEAQTCSMCHLNALYAAYS